MDTIQIKDKQFTVSIKEQDIQKEVIRVADRKSTRLNSSHRSQSRMPSSA